MNNAPIRTLLSRFYVHAEMLWADGGGFPTAERFGEHITMWQVIDNFFALCKAAGEDPEHACALYGLYSRDQIYDYFTSAWRIYAVENRIAQNKR